MLIVDDNPFNIIAYKMMFDQLSIEIDSAGGCDDAMALVRRKYEGKGTTYKLILMDYSMPDYTGPEVTTMILEYLR